jgi:hypothetical protein
MSKHTKDTLHELIKHMSKSEKRYFKVLSSRHTIGEENNYILLFDFIEAQKEFDQDAIFKHFKGETFLNKFSITKKRLYDYIIHALSNFHNSNSIDSQIFTLINSSDILYKKSLYYQSFKLLKSAKKTAQKHSKYNLLSEINLKIKRIYESQENVTFEEINLMLEEDESFHAKSLTYDKFWNLKSKLFHLLNSRGVSKTDDDVLKFKEIIDELLISAKKHELSFDAHYLYNHIYSAYFFAIDSFEDCYKYLKANIDLLEENEETKNDHINKYFSILTNLIYIASRLDKKQDLKIWRVKLNTIANDDIHRSNEDLQIKLFSSLYSLDLTLFSMNGEFEQALKIIPIIENGLIHYDDKITESRKAFFYFKISGVYFSVGDYHLSLKYLNKILNNPALDNQEDIKSCSYLLCLLIHFEMKNESFIPYVLKNTQRDLKSRNRLYEFENQFLKCINKLIKTPNEIDREELWKELYLALISLKDSHSKRLAFEYFDFITWTKAKSNRGSFIELLR